MPHLFCFGLGYTANVLAKRLLAQGWQVTGTARTSDGAAALKQAGYRGLVYDGDAPAPDVGRALANANHILLSVPPGPDCDPVYLHHGDDIANSAAVQWIGYLSTIGVYGDAGGDWVDETTVANPGSERGKRRLDAENTWRALGKATQKPVMVFRLPGIYGPGRNTLEDVRAGKARSIVKPGQVFNRIHVDDIATALEAAIRTPMADRVFNITDDEPAPPQDVVNFAADLLQTSRPPSYDFATADLTQMARSFYSESKRVSNARMKQELGVSLAYPNYRDGLKAIAAHHE